MSVNTYEIVIQGVMDESWLDWFGAVDVGTACAEEWEVLTTLKFRTDQSGLVGLIRRLHGVGVVLVGVRREK